MVAARLLQGLMFGLILHRGARGDRSSDPHGWINYTVLLVVAILFLITAVHELVQGDHLDAPPPKSMTMLTSATPTKALLVGVGIIAVSVKFWVFTLFSEQPVLHRTPATGGKGGHRAFVAPSWEGVLPTDVVEHCVPSNSVIFAIRIAASPGNESDLADVNRLQESFSPTALTNWGNPDAFGKAGVPDLGVRPDYDGDLALYQTLADLLAENPPPPGHQAAVLLLGRAGPGSWSARPWTSPR